MTTIGLILLGFLIGGFVFIRMIKSPILAISFVFAALPLEPFFPGFGGLNLGRTAGIIALLAWFIKLIQDQNYRSPLKDSKLVNIFLIFGFGVLFSSGFWLLSPGGMTALSSAITVILLIIFAFMIQSSVRTKKDIELICLSLGVASAIACIPAFLFANGIDVYSMFGGEPPSDLSEESMRASNIGGNANELGIMARNGFFAGLLYFNLNGKKIPKLLILSVMMVCLAGLFLSGSRTNFYGTIVLLLSIGGIYIWKGRIKLKQVLIPTFLMIGLLIFGWGLVPDQVKDRLLLGQNDSTIAERADSRADFTKSQRENAIEYFGDYPFTGVGLNRTNQVTGHLGAHDSFSVLIGETGLFGSIPFTILIFISITILVRHLRVPSIKNIFPSALLIGSICSLLVMGMAGGLIILYDRTFYLTLGLIIPICYYHMGEDKSNIQSNTKAE